MMMIYMSGMIYHPGSGTYIDMHECIYVDDAMADAIDDGSMPVPDTEGPRGAGTVFQEYAKMKGWV